MLEVVEKIQESRGLGVGVFHPRWYFRKICPRGFGHFRWHVPVFEAIIWPHERISTRVAASDILGHDDNLTFLKTIPLGKGDVQNFKL